MQSEINFVVELEMRDPIERIQPKSLVLFVSPVPAD